MTADANYLWIYLLCRLRHWSRWRGHDVSALRSPAKRNEMVCPQLFSVLSRGCRRLHALLASLGVGQRPLFALLYNWTVLFGDEDR